MKTISLFVLSFAFPVFATSLPAPKPAVTGCYEIVNGQFEDGASYYKAIEDKILAPLRADSATLALAKFLESALIVDGYLQVDKNLCESIEKALN